jgi:transcriptional regulator with XRE-family HTH domain
MREATKLEQAIRDRMRKLRIEHGWTQEDLAGRMQVWGFEWTHDTVKNLEVGTRRLSIEEFFGTVRLFGGEGEFFGADAGALELSPLWAVEVGGLGEIVAGNLTPQEVFGEAVLTASGITESQLAEKKAAAALGISIPGLKKAARRAWGKSLTKERERRLDQQEDSAVLSPRTRQARRGHVTRELLKELRGQGVGRGKR